MAAIGETENALVQLEGNVDVNAVLGIVGATKKFFGGGKPKELAVEFEMQSDQAVLECDKHVFALTSDGANALILRLLREI